ncbi:MAG TPA: type II secretion system protein [Candidatus Saccharimonadaceae bacterium]|nr:type II secretion system protein [Candidatus Saccharimonadaceae bacterium]|tara:strand:- start:2736 stop:3257 length:522 start_codon:yes stop_codon:yes gene_type:complete
MNVQKKEKGFTIIEVVLVLAIAGLIFLMVFIALPALQRNQRDTQRRNDMGRLQTAVANYSSANRGSIPTNTVAGWDNFVNTYLTTAGDTFVDPSGANANQGTGVDTYVITPTPAGTLTGGFIASGASATQNIIYATPGTVCNTSDSASTTSAGSRKVSFRLALEGGGYYCINN